MDVHFINGNAFANGRRRGWLALAAAFILLAAPIGVPAANPPALSEYQVKALFLINFTKYVDWPTNAFPTTNAPMVIGLMGENQIDEELRQIAGSKTVNGHPLLLKDVTDIEEARSCHILFISASEQDEMPHLLPTLQDAPVLTVSETGSFLQQGGIIDMVMKASKVRLEVNLAAARQAHLTISSRVLGVADKVLGRASPP